MIVVELKGGLGNQMFQYALGKYLALKHDTRLYLDKAFLEDRSSSEMAVFRDYDLDIFNVDHLFWDEKRSLTFKVKNSTRLKRKMLSFIGRTEGLKIVREKSFSYSGKYLKLGDNVYLVGYWQSYRYLEPAKEKIASDFSLKESISNPGTLALLDGIRNDGNSVCLNVRRGDFINNAQSVSTHGFVGGGYIENGVAKIAEKVPSPHFYVFSDDLEWCRENIRTGYPCTFVSHEHKGPKFSHYLELMKNCSHFIIPNSTFGWWAAWLCKNPSKTVIAPKQWFANPKMNAETESLLPPEWLRI